MARRRRVRLRRVLALLVAATVSALGIVVTLLTVSGSGWQFSRRLEENWGIAAKLAFERPRAVDLNTVGFDRLRVEADPVLATGVPAPGGDHLLDLVDVRWRRADLVPRDGIDLDSARLDFRTGILRIVREDASGWNFDNLVSALRAGWVERLPASIGGEELRVRLFRRSVREITQLDFWLRDLVFEREGSEAELTALLEGPSFREGNISWRTSPPGPDAPGGGVWLSLDDLDLERFPFEKLTRLFSFPWPKALESVSGRGYLDWRLDPAGSRYVLDHYQSTLRVGLPLPLRYLSGTVVAEGRSLRWTLTRGHYSRSSLSGELFADLDTTRLEGSIELEGVLEDRQLPVSFPERWRTLIRRLDPAGEGSLELHFDGIPIPGLFAALRSATVRVENARVEAQRGGDAVAGSFTFYPQRDSWTFDGDTLVSWVRGLRLPPSRWEGRASASRFEMRRLPEPGIPGRMELDLLLLPGDEGLEFTVRVADAAMGTMLGSGLEGGRWSLLTTGSWQHETGLETVTEIEWEGLVLPPGTPWPARGLQGPVSGYVRARRDFDDMRLERIRVRDDETLWEGSGRVRGDGVWVVTGRASSRRLLPRFLAPLPVSPSLDPGEGVEFEIRGPFLEWDLLRP